MAKQGCCCESRLKDDPPRNASAHLRRAGGSSFNDADADNTVLAFSRVLGFGSAFPWAIIYLTDETC